MRRAMVAVAVALLAAAVLAQSGTYTQVENDYGADYVFSPGRPIEVKIEIEGIRFDAVAVVPTSGVQPGNPVPCEITVTGSSVASKKAAINIVLLLEDDIGRGLERVTLDQFKVKSERSFEERQKRDIPAAALSGATRVYVLFQVAF